MPLGRMLPTQSQDGLAQDSAVILFIYLSLLANIQPFHLSSLSKTIIIPAHPNIQQTANPSMKMAERSSADVFAASL